MRTARLLWAALSVLGMGAAAPGCFLFPGEDPSLGRVCASPAEGGEHCVPANYDPAAAWDKAMARGSLPIQMWAERPQDVSLHDLVTSRAKLERWFKDIDKVVRYVRDTQRNAESYKASMDGRLGALLREARGRQAALLAEKPVDAIGQFKGTLLEKAKAEKAPLVAEFANEKLVLGEALATFEDAKHKAAPLEAAYAALVEDFSGYRATEATESATYVDLAKKASSAGLDTLDQAEQAILAASLAASKKPVDLSLAAMKLSAELSQLELAFQETLAHDALHAQGAKTPDMTSGALRSIHAMLGYIGQRVKRSDATAKALLSNIVLRRQALALLGAGQSARAEAMQARAAKASTAFEASMSDRVAALGEGKGMNAALGLPYLAKRYDALRGLLQLGPLCANASASWRGAGCKVIGDDIKAMTTELKTTIPAQIASGISVMRQKGVDAALLDAAQAKLESGDVRGAAMAYDAALRGAEGT